MLSPLLLAAISYLPYAPTVENLWDDASFVVLAEVLVLHDVDGMPVEEVAVVRSLKGTPPADRLFYVPPCSCGGTVIDPAERGDRILLFLAPGDGLAQRRSFWKALDALTEATSFVSVNYGGRFRADAEGMVALPTEEAESDAAVRLADLLARVEAKQELGRLPLK
jgi:hypothetical protein